ncbi:Holliday junction resolvase RecU [Aerococcus kribbianus]|uniref:Holliday junction resolvase RecU n=1 Tax=Aerococcus kribbianus TaxID=2999064 RepID=A0A9X3FR02_9LACT|nr:MULTISPECIES: Holliday junction resolvase RecU [unclassified Aerococcus]MCZ0716732.1 Holliday junction resolvase RecU [Aerococcus sp. YH-aer221]MCZ0725020.1 Holliday junction resolvase RecU [Aerococcus sp. YH-aer222]
MRYPNGQSFTGLPHRRNKRPKKTVYGKRGMRLEEMLNQSNAYYREHGIAIIHKKPTPIQVVKVDYPKRSRAVIKEAYYRQASTTDYNGVYRSYYIDFEAKQTDLKQHFPLQNIHDHQISHMQACYDQGGICFLVIHFKQLALSYLYPFEALIEDWQAYQSKESNKIPLERIKSLAYPIQSGYMPALDYISALDAYINNLEKEVK